MYEAWFRSSFLITFSTCFMRNVWLLQLCIQKQHSLRKVPNKEWKSSLPKMNDINLSKHMMKEVDSSFELGGF
jgi:hypothetical protein